MIIALSPLLATMLSRMVGAFVCGSGSLDMYLEQRQLRRAGTSA